MFSGYNLVRKHWTVSLWRCEIAISQFKSTVYCQLLSCLEVLCILYDCAFIRTSLSNLKYICVILPRLILIWRCYYYTECNRKFNVRNNYKLPCNWIDLQQWTNRSMLTFRGYNWKSWSNHCGQTVWYLAVGWMCCTSIWLRQLNWLLYI